MAEEEAMAEEDPEFSEMLEGMDMLIKDINELTRQINRI
jgi:soluble cytochrome b562